MTIIGILLFWQIDMGIWVQVLMLVWQKSYWQSSSLWHSYCWPPTFTSCYSLHTLRMLSAAKAPCSFWAPLCMVLWWEHSSIPAFVQCSQVTFVDTWSFITIPRLNKLRFLQNTDPSLIYVAGEGLFPLQIVRAKRVATTPIQLTLVCPGLQHCLMKVPGEYLLNGMPGSLMSPSRWDHKKSEE